MASLRAVYLIFFSVGHGHFVVGDFPNSALSSSHLRENSFFCLFVHGAGFDFFFLGFFILSGFMILCHVCAAFLGLVGSLGLMIGLMDVLALLEFDLTSKMMSL